MKDEKTLTGLLIGVLATQLLFLGALFVQIKAINDNIGGLYQTIASLSSGEKVKAMTQQTGMVYKVVEDVLPGSGGSLGPADAPITIVEFSDFSCSACKAAQAQMKSLVADAGGAVRLVYRHYPGAGSQDAALAAECALRQDSFWPMHDRIFDSFGDYTREKLLEHAAEVGLETASFQECLESPDAHERLRQDQLAAQEYGVPGTPTFLINGRMVLGMYPQPVLEQLIGQIRREDGV